MWRVLAFCLAFMSLGLTASSAFSGARFAVLVGANNGGQSRPELRYAARDAENLAEVLQKLGNFNQDSMTVLKQPTRAGLYQVLQQFAERVAHGSRDSEFLFYYSGHADEQGLLLRNERVPYEILREKLKNFPAKVKIFVVDACSSGALTHSKGGSMQAPFLVQGAQDTSGYAIMTSSSTEESSQESERLRSSFFTHFLLSGLRGAADMDKDRQVTLSEAYQYAYQGTLQSTSKTQVGAQHPSYEFQLKGRGDLILTDLRHPNSSLEFAEDMEGEFFVRSAATRLFIEIDKKAGTRETLALEPGAYEIVRFAGKEYFQATVELNNQQRLQLSGIKFAPVPAEKVATRGTVEFPQFYRRKFFHFSPVPGAEFMQKSDDHSMTSLHLSPLVGTVDRLEGLGFGLLGHMSHNVSGLALSPTFTFNEGTVNGLQASLGLNVSEDLNGVQLGSMNYAYQIYGGQLGVLNTGGLVTGAQVGFFNVAESVEGLQLGLVNFAERSRGLSLAPIMIVRNGIVRADTWIDSLGMANLSLRSGTPYYYSNIFVGGDRERTMVGAGFGLRMPLEKLAFAADLSWGFYHRQIPGSPPYTNTAGEVIVSPTQNATLHVNRLRVFCEWPLTDSLFAMAGLSRVEQLYGGNDQKRLPLARPLTLESKDSFYEREHLGWMFGLSYSLLESYL